MKIRFIDLIGAVVVIIIVRANKQGSRAQPDWEEEIL